jgi:hypothetical protein
MIDAVEAPQEPVKRKRGRPPGSKNKVYEDGNLPPDVREQDGEPTDSVELNGELAPYPAIAAESSIEAILHVWNECLTLRQREHGGLYLYREQPVYTRVLKHGRLVNENIQKFTAADGAVTLEMIRQKHRAGAYRMRLNQRIVKPYGELSQATFKIEGDYATADEMPNIDLDRLDLDHPDNKSFVRILKLRGAIKPDESPQESEDMAASEVLGTIAQSAITQLSEQRQQPQAAAPANDNGAVKEVVSLLRETIQSAKPPAQQGTVTDHVKSLVDIAKAMAPPAIDLSPFMTLQQQNNALVEQMMRKDVERAEAAAAQAKAEAAELRAAMPKAKSLDEQFDDLEKAVTRYKRIRGEREEPEETAGAPAAAGDGLGFWGALPSILEKGERILSLVANIAFNYAAIKAGAGAAPVNPATGAADTNPAAPELSPEQQEQAQRMQNVISQLVPLAAPMLKQFQSQKSGTEFAKFVFENYGPETIATVQGVEGGRNTILGMLQSYPPVWNVVSASQPTLARFTLFLDQFLTYQPSSAAVQ